MYKPYHYELPYDQFDDSDRHDSVCGPAFNTIEECVEDCKRACAMCNIDYDRRDVKLFMTDADGTWEVTEEGELAG